MAKSKKMNEAALAKLVKELDSVGELILTRQDEKQVVMNDFDAERARYVKGRISEDTLLSSSKKTNAELIKLDKNIREAIIKVGKISMNIRAFAIRQAPKVFRASVSGVKPISRKKKVKKAKKAKKAKKKTVKKPKSKGVKASKATLKKEMTLDRKFSKK
ncbi:hypothetical protein K8R30_01235 [archaeon]|nr:hypothetical protein [archaeon]